jgi:hypothetical protein
MVKSPYQQSMPPCPSDTDEAGNVQDEISTGLDSSTTFQIVKATRNYVHLLKVCLYPNLPHAFSSASCNQLFGPLEPCESLTLIFGLMSRQTTSFRFEPVLLGMFLLTDHAIPARKHAA